MGLETSLTSKTWNPFDGSTYNSTGDQIEFDYSTLGFTSSAGDSYKSTSGDVFKVYVDGVRIYRASDVDYASGTGFLEDGDTATTLNGVTATWSDTSNTVWTIDTANQNITIDTGNILATALYKLSASSGLYSSGAGNSDITFSSSTIIEVRRSSQNESSPSVDFSNASILTEQDLDNSSLNVFHMAQQAIVAAEKALPFNSGTGVFEAYQPGTTTRKKITQVADGVAANDATNVGQFNTHDTTITGYRDTTNDYKLESKDWAHLITSQVKAYSGGSVTGSFIEDSAKNWASGTTSAAPTGGSAKEWAIGGGGTMATTPDGSEYAAKEYATGTTAPLGSAKSWSTKDTTAVASSLFSAKEYASGSSATGGTSKQWALGGGGSFTEGTAVTGSSYSAKKYATDAINAETAVINVANAMSTIHDNFDDRYLGSLASSHTVAAASTITGAVWTKGSSLITSVTQATGTITVGQVLTVTDSSTTGWPTTTTVRILAYNAGTSIITINQIFSAAQSAGEGLTGVGYGVNGAYVAGDLGPSTDNDGATLLDGSLYYNTTTNALMVYDLGNTIWLYTKPSSSDQTNIDTVAGQIDPTNNVAAVAGKATEIGRIGTSAMAASIALIGTDAYAHASTGDIKLVADIAANVTKVADVDANVTKVADIDANVTKVADIDGNVTIVAGLGTNGADVTAVAGKATEIGRLGTADAVADMNTLGTAPIVADLNILADRDTELGLLGTSAMAHATTGHLKKLGDISTSVANASTNLDSINVYGDQYQVDDFSPSAPTTDGGSNALAAGDLAFDSTAAAMKVYNGTGWDVVAPTGSMDSGGGTFTGVVTFNHPSINSGGFSDNSQLNLSGTLVSRFYLSNSCLLVGDITLAGTVIIAKVSNDGNAATLTTDSTTRTITGIGTLANGELFTV